MQFEGKVVVVTGGAHGIGKCIVEEFEKEGAHVAIIDIKDNPYFVGDRKHLHRKSSVTMGISTISLTTPCHSEWVSMKHPMNNLNMHCALVLLHHSIFPNSSCLTLERMRPSSIFLLPGTE